LTPLILSAAIVATIALVLFVPRMVLRRAQDRLARRLLDRDGGGRFKLLTRAELVIGQYRRVPGVLGLTEEALTFEGLFGEAATLATSRIQKIVTGRRLANGRRLIRLEVLRLTRLSGGELEFVLSPASASAWRSHLGLWAAHERKAAMDEVTPGR
jgi:hypothetical protein